GQRLHLISDRGQRPHHAGGRGERHLVLAARAPADDRDSSSSASSNSASSGNDSFSSASFSSDSFSSDSFSSDSSDGHAGTPAAQLTTTRRSRGPSRVTISCSEVPAQRAQSATVGSPSSPGPKIVTGVP